MAAARPPRPAYPEPAAAQLLGVLWLAAVASGPWGVAAGSEEAPRCEDLRVGQYICKDPEINDATQEPVNCTNYTAHAPCFPAPNITCKDLRGNETHFTGQEVGFLKPTPCRNVNGYSYKVAVALSLFLGWLGADRFYLGYPALAKHTQEVQALAENASLSQAFPPPSAAACPSWTALLRVEAGPSVCPAQPLARLLSSTVLGERLTGLLKFCTVGFCGIGSLIDFILISMQIVGPSDGSSYIIDYYGTRLIRLTITNETFRKTQLYP